LVTSCPSWSLSNHDFLDLCLLNNWNYRHEAPHQAFVIFNILFFSFAACKVSAEKEPHRKYYRDSLACDEGVFFSSFQGFDFVSDSDTLIRMYLGMLLIGFISFIIEPFF
jgi:hypothetical protein